MTSKPRRVQAVRDGIIAASAELRAVARLEHDKARAEVADWVDGLFAGIADEKELREAATEALTLYRGGMGSFQDVGSAASAHVVGELYVALERGQTLSAESVGRGLPPAAHPTAAPTRRKPRTVQATLKEILGAIAELRAATRLGQDEQRTHVADWLDELFVDVTNRRGLREASAQALTLYRGGMGSFHDVGYAELDHAVTRLHSALRRGRSWFLRST